MFGAVSAGRQAPGALNVEIIQRLAVQYNKYFGILAILGKSMKKQCAILSSPRKKKPPDGGFLLKFMEPDSIPPLPHLKKEALPPAAARLPAGASSSGALLRPQCVQTRLQPIVFNIVQPSLPPEGPALSTAAKTPAAQTA